MKNFRCNKMSKKWYSTLVIVPDMKWQWDSFPYYSAILYALLSEPKHFSLLLPFQRTSEGLSPSSAQTQTEQVKTNEPLKKKNDGKRLSEKVEYFSRLVMHIKQHIHVKVTAVFYKYKSSFYCEVTWHMW